MAEITDKLGHWLDRSDRLLRPVEDSMNLVAALAIMFLMLLGVVQIVLRARWLFNAPIFGYIDLIELVMPALAILGFAYCQREGVHIRMDILIRRFEGRLLWAVEAFTTFFTMVIIGLIVRYSWVFFHDAYTSGDSTSDAELLVWPTRLMVPVALGVCVLRLVIQLGGSLRLAVSPDLKPVGVVVAKDVAAQAQEEIREVLGEGGEK
ncbi:MAG: TRAP transporter small permease [Proteobacteria bacterium]|nr:TRAP transporter small permease [Pseudomonadota bacterium]MCH8951033.1 TRAP transporter small permease [Pseudomonadota bacterium]